MLIKLNHPFVYQEDLNQLIDTDKLSTFINRLIKIGGKQDPDFYPPLKYMGDGWELFCEFFLKFQNGDHTLTYLYDYEPNLGVDNGIDGFGKCTLDGEVSTVQCKFCANPDQLLTNEHNIGNHATASLSVDGWKPNGKNLICITSGAGVHHAHAYYEQALCLNRKLISRRVNGNVAFWETFKSSVIYSTQNNEAS